MDLIPGYHPLKAFDGMRSRPRTVDGHKLWLRSYRGMANVEAASPRRGSDMTALMVEAWGANACLSGIHVGPDGVCQPACWVE